MLTRLYIDNFRCFVNFEHRPAKRELILGANGSGKSSFIEALLRLRLFVGKGERAGDLFLPDQRTRWLNQPEQTFELEARVLDCNYAYRLVIGRSLSPLATWVASETVHADGKPIFEFVNGNVHLYTDQHERKVTYEFDAGRSALATIVEGNDNHKLSQFKAWVARLYCFKIDPFLMMEPRAARAENEELTPYGDLRNTAPWYRHLVQDDPQQNAALIDSLRTCLDGFSLLKLEAAGQNIRLLVAEFGKNEFYFNELSDGQRCLICLYVILHFLIARGATVIIDEPDNFISLREIQPWLTAVTEAVEEGDGQVLLISHHPEVINQWAPGNGVQFVRDGAGPVRVEKFRGDVDSCLDPAELIARGWDRE